MDEDTTPSQFEPIVEVLGRFGVEFIVIGGRAETLLGSSRVTFDTDLCYRRTNTNLARLAQALAELAPTLRGAPPDLKFVIDQEALALGSNFTFDTKFGPLDLLGWVEPIGSYEALINQAEEIEFGNHTLHVISLDNLIRIKQHINRPKDRDSLMHLMAIRRIRDQHDEL